MGKLDYRLNVGLKLSEFPIITYISSPLAGENLQRCVEIPGECLEENIQNFVLYILSLGNFEFGADLKIIKQSIEYAQKRGQSKKKNWIVKTL